LLKLIILYVLFYSFSFKFLCEWVKLQLFFSISVAILGLFAKKMLYSLTNPIIEVAKLIIFLQNIVTVNNIKNVKVTKTVTREEKFVLPSSHFPLPSHVIHHHFRVVGHHTRGSRANTVKLSTLLVI